MADEYTPEQPLIPKLTYTDGLERPYEHLRHLDGTNSGFSACFRMSRSAGEGAHACTPTMLNELFYQT